MAQVILQIKDRGVNNSSYKKGDVVEAYSNYRTNAVHAQLICNPYKESTNEYGYLETTGLSYASKLWLSKFKYTKVGDVVTRLNLLTDEEETGMFSKDQVQARIDGWRKRRGQQGLPMFGDNDQLIWFEGDNFTKDGIDSTWTNIEAQTGLQQSDHNYLPVSENTLKKFMVLGLEDFTQEEAEEWTAPKLGNENNLLKKRNHFIEWEAITEMSEDTLVKVRDYTQVVDVYRKGDHPKALVKTKD